MRCTPRHRPYVLIGETLRRPRLCDAARTDTAEGEGGVVIVARRPPGWERARRRIHRHIGSSTLSNIRCTVLSVFNLHGQGIAKGSSKKR